MNPKNIDYYHCPVYKTRKEVFKAAHENNSFFDSFNESLTHSWKFYNTK